jgi:hypothetical protein
MEKSAARSHTVGRGANAEQFLPVAQGFNRREDRPAYSTVSRLWQTTLDHN